MLSAFPTQATVRRIRRLRLRTRDADSVQRASTALSDALHTASMPEAEGARLLVIKRLNLGRISTRASSPTLAVLIGHATRAAAGRAVRFDQPGAEHADAVTFPSRTDALVALARRLARDESAGEWFWNHIAPGWSQTLSRIARWGFLLAAAGTLPGPSVATGAVLHEAAIAGTMDELIAAVQPREAAHWLREMGWTPARAREATCRPLHISPEIAAVLVPLRDLLGGDDLRVVWVGALLAVHEQPARSALSDLAVQIAAWLREIQGGRDAMEPSTLLPHLSRPDQDDSSPHPRSQDDTPTGAGSSISASIDGGTHKADSPARPETPPENDPPWNDATAFSPCAGLLFIATVLTRIRFGRFLARHPEMLEAAFPSRLLCFIGEAAGMAGDDPIMLALTPKTSGAGRAASLEGAEPYFRAWLTAVQRWCDRRARVDWCAVICRPGQVWITRTEIEVSFAPEQADIALRRAALDVDPGWLPWLGRVIRFHYVDSHERAR